MKKEQITIKEIIAALPFLIMAIYGIWVLIKATILAFPHSLVFIVLMIWMIGGILYLQNN